MKLTSLLLALAWPGMAQGPALWLRYPALSPDGQTIVFSYQGDLYRVSSAGGTATPLTLGGSHNFMPVWSKDGKQLAFASDRHGSFDVFVMPAEGGPARRLTTHAAQDLPTAFTPDGMQVLFTSRRTPTAQDAQFPYRAFAQTWTVPVEGGMPRLVHSATMEAAVFDAQGNRLLFQDIKGGENAWRKHHTSSVTRDIRLYDTRTGRFQTLTTFPGEDRNPVFGADGDTVFHLTEESGSFNVVKRSLKSPAASTPVTRFTKHPVRFLSVSRDQTLCYTWDGEIYTQKEGASPKKLDIRVPLDGRGSLERIMPVNGGLTEFEVSPNGKEIAYVVRGEVFVSSVEGGVTKRITNTPGQERSVAFSPDGRTLVYAGERSGSWDLYTCRLTRKEESYFHAATVLEEKPLVATAAEEFQPLFSPDGKEVAYLEERTALKVVDVATGKTRTVLPAGRNYSYADGDQDFVWSPDGKWLLLSFNTGLGWMRDVGLLAADGSGKLVNLTRSGYYDGQPQFSSDGSMIYWASDRDGHRDERGGGSTQDVYGIFLTKAAWDRHKLSKEDFALLKEREDKEAKEKAKPADKGGDKEAKKDALPELKIDWEGLEDRKARLTLHTAEISAERLSKAGDKLFYLARFEKGFDLWVSDLRSRETKLLAKLDARNASMERSVDGKALFVIAEGRVSKVDAESGKREAIAINGELVLRPAEERAYIFEHAWRQAGKKFYVADLHGVDWPFYRDAYRKFLPHIQNNHDFAELLSELLGELNASHTGGRYAPPQGTGDVTASLGLFLDPTAKGLTVAEVLKGGPMDRADSRLKPGDTLTAIDGVPLATAQDPAAWLNRKAGLPTLLTFANAKGETWDEAMKPIAPGQENELLYRRWVDRSRALVEQRSGGKLGYVHVRGMDDGSMRVVVDEVMGRHLHKEALVVDTRFNGGGNLHEQLSDFLSGKKYFDVIPRGQAYGFQPLNKWNKPSIVVMGEGNYSDAHLFPVAYKLKGLGKTVGMPVPGTGTFVWWETQIDPTIVFGIPQGGWRTPDGKFCENHQLEPDLKVVNTAESLAEGRDLQLEAAVDALLKDLKK